MVCHLAYTFFELNLICSVVKYEWKGAIIDFVLNIGYKLGMLTTPVHCLLDYTCYWQYDVILLTMLNDFKWIIGQTISTLPGKHLII